MAVTAKTGSFAVSTATAGNTQVISGVGFMPKAIIFWTNQETSGTDTVANSNTRSCFGFAVSPTDRRCITTVTQDALGTSACFRGQRTDACFATINTSPAFSGLMDLQSMDSDGFTLVIDAQFSIAGRVFYLALGGDSITSQTTGSFLTATSTGNYDITSVGFQPTCVLFAAEGSTSTATGTDTDANWSLGAATGSSNQGVAALSSIDAAGTSIAKYYAQHLECIVDFNTTPVTRARDSFVSFLSNGFRLNRLEGTGATSVFFLALAGVSASVGNLLTATSLTTVAVTGLGFNPTGVLFFSASKAENTQDTVAAHAKWSIGASSGSAGVVAAERDRDAQGTTDVARAVEYDNVYANITDTAATLAGTMALQSFDSDGFTCVMTDADPNQNFVNYIAFGNPPITGTLSVTLDAATLAGTGTVDVTGTLSVTLDAATLAGTGTVDVTGTLSVTLDAATLAGTGTVVTVGGGGSPSERIKMHVSISIRI